MLPSTNVVLPELGAVEGRRSARRDRIGREQGVAAREEQEGRPQDSMVAGAASGDGAGEWDQDRAGRAKGTAAIRVTRGEILNVTDRFELRRNQGERFMFHAKLVVQRHCLRDHIGVELCANWESK